MVTRTRRKSRKKQDYYFSFHVHSQFSSLDGMPTPTALVQKAVKMGQPAIGSLDHGNMSATVKMYKACKDAGIKFFPGFEGYMIDPARDDWEAPEKGAPKVGRFHFGIQALDEIGYKGLVKLSSLSHTRPRFNRFSRLTIGDLAKFGKEYGEHVAFYTGCYFGYVQQTLVQNEGGKGKTNAERIIRQFMQWYPNLFVELQNHDIDHSGDDNVHGYGNDDDIVNTLYDIAQRVGAPVVIGQDSHYADQNDKHAHNLMKQMVYAGSDDEFPGDSFHLASSEWVREHYDDEVWEAAQEGFRHLLSLHNLNIKPLDKFTPDVPKISDDPTGYVRRTCEAFLKSYLRKGHFGKKLKAEYMDRLEEELAVINTLHMDEYFVIVRDYVEWCHNNKVFVEARGSANGSLVCFALGISQIDPIKHGTDFPRFLSVDRIKPPDIDMDVDDSRRGELMHYLLSKYDSVQIGTFNKLGATHDEREDREGGSALQSWLTWKRRECMELAENKLTRKAERNGDKPPTQASIKAYGSAVFRNRYGDVEDVRDVEDAAPEEYVGLRRLIKMDSVFKSYGVHAGGVLLSGEHVKISDYIPTMLVASSETIVSQYDMDDVEEFGLLKMDILGQSTLRTMKLVNEAIGTKNSEDFTWIPEDDPDAIRILRSGRMNTGVFHQEGYCVPLETPVLTPTGWRQIQHLKVGDAVVDPAGGYATVTETHHKGPEQVYEVTLHDGSSVEATSEHLWHVVLGGKEAVKDTAYLKDLVDRTKRRPALVGHTPVDYRSGGDTPIDPYVLGLLLGNGNFSRDGLVRFITMDQEPADAILQAHPDTELVQDGQQAGKATRYYLRRKAGKGVHSILSGLRSLGLSGLSGSGKFVPESYLWAPVAVRQAVLQGLMDTDGTAKASGSMCFSTVSPQLAKDVQFLVRSLGGMVKITESDRAPHVVVSGQEPSTLRRIYILDSIRGLGSFVPFRLSRKVDRVRPNRTPSGRGIRSITPTRVTEVACIAVSSVNATYITKDFIVTHNTKAKGGKNLPIKNTKDCVLWQALYMPGAMDTGQTAHVERARSDPRFRRSVTYIHPIFEKHLSETYGAYVYQNQVMNILRDLGMDVASINVFLKVVKASGKGAGDKNREKLKKLRDIYSDLCIDNGISPRDEEESWTALCGFAEYGFNKNHAAGYGIRSYRCAYLKAHYPLEFMTALLRTWAGKNTKGRDGMTKEDQYIRECRRLGIELLAPHVNISGESWSTDYAQNAIRRGLSSVHGLGAKSAVAIADAAPYSSVEDMTERLTGRELTGGKKYVQSGGEVVGGFIGALLNAGALEGLPLKDQGTLFDDEEDD